MSVDPQARWLLLIHQLPRTPAYLRVKTARQLQKLGAVAVKNSVYVLPNTDGAQESFTWLGREIADGGGDFSICTSNFVGGASDQSVEALFKAARGKEYQALNQELRDIQQSLGRGRRIAAAKRVVAARALARVQEQLADSLKLDFFGAPERETTTALMAALLERLREPDEAPIALKPVPKPRVRGAIWVTRKGVHVDRIASAWLIRRFIDPAAKFKFVPARGYTPLDGELRFDMFDAEYTHQGDLCTFEVLARTFDVSDASVQVIGEVVHDLDVHDDKFAHPERAGVERLITGIALTQPDDDARLVLGAQLFDALYEAWRKKKP